MPVSRREFLGQVAALNAAVLGVPLLAQAQDAPITKPIPSSDERIPVIGVGTNRYRSGDPAYVARLRDSLAAFAGRGGGVAGHPGNIPGQTTNQFAFRENPSPRDGTG